MPSDECGQDTRLKVPRVTIMYEDNLICQYEVYTPYPTMTRKAQVPLDFAALFKMRVSEKTPKQDMDSERPQKHVLLNITEQVTGLSSSEILPSHASTVRAPKSANANFLGILWRCTISSCVGTDGVCKVCCFRVIPIESQPTRSVTLSNQSRYETNS